MGKDYYLLKGAGLGAAEWAALYGVMSNMGATRIFPTKPKDALIAFASHVVFGTVKMVIVTQLGDERLFKPAHIVQKINEPQELKIQPD